MAGCLMEGQLYFDLVGGDLDTCRRDIGIPVLSSYYQQAHVCGPESKTFKNLLCWCSTE